MFLFKLSGFSDVDPYDVLPNVMPMSLTPNKNDALEINLPEYYTIAIVSRRSRHRAGKNFIALNCMSTFISTQPRKPNFQFTYFVMIELLFSSTF